MHPDKNVAADLTGASGDAAESFRKGHGHSASIARMSRAAFELDQEAGISSLAHRA
jgi:hypothetical protein